ncbi:hypothetical protein [Lactiplantibacillus plantarum]|uniref:hypothetical protein n=1 Tax=Lactiplantibacillus plantarum TaxID=1590 RepID=UPI001BA8E084|nr:hypothetical protein [Lactiplantibacillus plantarum]MBS0936341.1 hypothetical protein [Lactiplantibacillus plantarum]MBS0943770.1 hypothetical protein [Lactiplantibacillus plantarum]
MEEQRTEKLVLDEKVAEELYHKTVTLDVPQLTGNDAKNYDVILLTIELVFNDHYGLLAD